MTLGPHDRPFSLTPTIAERVLPGAALRVLLVEDSEADALIVQAVLGQSRVVSADVVHVVSLADGLERLEAGNVDMVLLDLYLPDSRGIETFRAVADRFPDVPIVVMSASNDETIALGAVREGAQDYLVKGDTSPEALGRALRYSVERHRLLAVVKGLSLNDELTGLYNRRGFLTLASGHLQSAMRGQRRFLIMYGDLDGLKVINDTYGHHAGDQAIAATARILASSFRQSDLVGRLGGDEFAVLAGDASLENEAVLRERLDEAFAAFNATSDLPYELKMTIGVVSFVVKGAVQIEPLLAAADRELYKRKAGRRSSLTMKEPPAS